MINPAPLLAVATGFMAAKQLFAASELGVFAALTDTDPDGHQVDHPRDAAELAAATGLPERSARILADAMVGLGLLRVTGAKYANTEVTAHYLAGGPNLDLRPFLAFWDTLSYPHWQHHTESMRTAKPGPFELDEQRMPVFMNGVQTYNALHALMLAEHYDFGAHHNVLDLAGLSTAFLAEAAARNPELRGAFVSTGPLLEMARTALDPALADRIEFHDVDALTDAVPGEYDTVLLEHVIHRYDPEQNQTLLRRSREVVPAGGRLLLLDFLLDAGDGRRLDPVLAGEYLVIDGTVVYPEDEVRGWLAATGWRWLETRPLPGSPRVIIAEAV